MENRDCYWGVTGNIHKSSLGMAESGSPQKVNYKDKRGFAEEEMLKFEVLNLGQNKRRNHAAWVEVGQNRLVELQGS